MTHFLCTVRGGLFAIFVAAAVPFLGAHAALFNVSIDDTNVTRIDYFGSWIEAKDGTFGLHHVADKDGLSARFRFKGVALYYMSPKWPYPVGTELTLFTGPTVSWTTSLDLQDHSQSAPNNTGATVESEIVAIVTDLPNSDHALVIEIGKERPFAIVDQIIYTVDDEEPDGSKSSQNTSLPAGTVAAIGAVSGVVGLILLAVSLWYYMRRRRAKQQNIPNFEELHALTSPNLYQDPSSRWGVVSSSHSTDGSSAYGAQPYDVSAFGPYAGDATTYTKSSYRPADPYNPEPHRPMEEGIAPPQYERVPGENTSHHNRQEKSRRGPATHSEMSWNEPASSASSVTNYSAGPSY